MFSLKLFCATNNSANKVFKEYLRLPLSKIRGNSDQTYARNYEGYKLRTRDIIEQQVESVWSNVFFLSQIIFIIVSITSFVVATLPQFRDPYDLPIPAPDSPAYPFFVIEGKIDSNETNVFNVSFCSTNLKPFAYFTL